jgi:hypothetical protein
MRMTADYLGSEVAEVALDDAIERLPPWTLPTVQTVLEASAML